MPPPTTVVVVQPAKPADRVVVGTAGTLLILSLLIGGAGVIGSVIMPAGTRVVAPLVCPADTARSVVATRWGGTSKGGRSMTWDLYCLTEDGFGTVPPTWKMLLSLFGTWTVVGAVLLLLSRLKDRLTARPEGPPGAE